MSHFTLIVKQNQRLYHLDSLNGNHNMREIFLAAKLFLKCSEETKIIQVRTPMQVENECMFRACIHALIIDLSKLNTSPNDISFGCVCQEGKLPTSNDAYALRLFIASCLYGKHIPRNVLNVNAYT